MAENHTLPQLQAVRLRLALLDYVSGVPLPGVGNLYVTDALVKVSFGWEKKDGTEIEEENGQGAVCAYIKGDSTLKRGNVGLEICTPDPRLTTLLDGGVILEDGDRLGAAAPALGTAPQRAVSLEVWSKRVNNGTLDPESPYAWWVYPRLQAILPGDHEQGNSALKPSYTAEAYENPNWFDGPLNDWPAASDRVHQWLPTRTLPAVTYATTLAAS